jgi:hypothetical protein
MDVHNRPSCLQSAVLLVVFLLHGSLILAFLREKPTYRDRDPPPELATTIFFINPQRRLPLPPPETSRIQHRPTSDLQHQLRPDAPISSPDTTVHLEDQGSAASPPTDWFAEAHRSAAEIADSGEPGRAAESPSSPTASAPWDPHPHLLESTGHGLKLRIPVRIAGDLIDHCFANMDLGHNEGGKWELYQLKCAFRKQPARGDLFDSLRKPPESPK